jgi:hypothetical protein
MTKHIPVTGDAWLNPQGRLMVTLTLPDGSTAILAVPHRNRAGDAESSQAFKVIMAALAGGDTE